MNNPAKEQIGCDVICRSHSARTERDLYRICPSKLSKRELEDLYFALLENNLDLKKTVNIQQDKIKVLSTRVQRMSAVQKNVAGKDKDCCASKSAVNEQKESISNLKKINERMGERICVLNMRLCSAKQFLKRSPSQATNAHKASSRGSFKNSSMSALNAKPSDSNTRTTAVSCLVLDKDGTPRTSRTVETETKQSEKDDLEKLCNENKCRTMMDELKEKIVNLQEELSTSHNEYSQRIARLERQVSELRGENLRVRSEHAGSQHQLQRREERADRLQDDLRTADAKCNELTMELSVEKRKVIELETGLKLANMSSNVVKTIEQLAATKEEKKEPLSELRRNESSCSFCSQKTGQRISSSKTDRRDVQPHLEVPTPRKTKEEVKFSQSDDSGCTDLNKSCETDDDQVMVKMNKDLMKKIAELQTQLDLLRVSAAGGAVTTQNDPKEFESYDVETKDVDESQNGNAGDLGSMIMDAGPTLEKSNSDLNNVVERDKDTEARKKDDEEATVSKPWEDYLITGRCDNLGDNFDKVDQKSVSSTTIKDKSDSKINREEDSRYQIPGPIPVAYPTQSSSKDKRKIYRNNQISKDSFNERMKNRKGNPEEKTVKIFENSKESCFYSDNKSRENNSVAEGRGKVYSDIAKLKEYAKDIEADELRKSIDNNMVDKKDVEAKPGPTATRDSILVNRKKLGSSPSQLDEDDEDDLDDEPTMAEVKKESSTFMKLGSACTPPLTEINEKSNEQATQIEGNVNMYELCESRATICRCPALERRDVAVFRSCSGTLRFRTTAAADKLRRCACQLNTNSSGTQVDPPRRASPASPARACARSTSPDNTEHEISSLTDLPSDKGGKSPRFVISPGGLSPGEEKATMTYTETETNTDCYGSLSEGEMPTGHVRNTSIGERPPITTRTSMPPTTETMEATLLSISEELARCRQLLLSQRPQEVIKYSSLM